MNFNGIEQYMKEFLVEEKHVPGCDVAIMKEHELCYRFSCGFSDIGRTAPVSEQDLYYLYSCTKPITVTAAMRLVEEGKLGLDTPVSEYLPAYKKVYLLCNGEHVKPNNTMTVRHLFTMTGGLDYDKDKASTRKVLEDIGDDASTRQIVDSYAESPLAFSPGDRYKYSLCHDVLAAVIEEVAGMRFSDYLSKVIFEPLGMGDTTFHPTGKQISRIAALYENNDDKICPIYRKPGFYFSSNYESGGGGLVSSVNDYIRFSDTMASGGISQEGYRLLKPESIQRMQVNQLPAITTNSEFSCAAGDGYGYGLGVRTRISHLGGNSPLGEFGWDGAAGCYVMMDPKNKLSIFFAMHLTNWPKLIGCGHAPIRDMAYDALSLS